MPLAWILFALAQEWQLIFTLLLLSSGSLWAIMVQKCLLTTCQISINDYHLERGTPGMVDHPLKEMAKDQGIGEQFRICKTDRIVFIMIKSPIVWERVCDPVLAIMCVLWSHKMPLPSVENICTNLFFLFFIIIVNYKLNGWRNFIFSV